MNTGPARSGPTSKRARGAACISRSSAAMRCSGRRGGRTASRAGGAPYRTLVCYKETHANAKIDPLPNVWTGTWRDPRFSPPADGGRPENALTGTLFTVNSGTTGIRVPEVEGKLRFWRNTSVANLPPGTSATMPNGTLGYEWDEDHDNGFRPAGLIRMSDTTVAGAEILLDFGSTYGPGTANHALTLYRHASGALVFGAGTVQWSWGLDSNHDRGAEAPTIVMQQATVNLFADMGVQPRTLQAGLLPADAVRRRHCAELDDHVTGERIRRSTRTPPSLSPAPQRTAAEVPSPGSKSRSTEAPPGDARPARGTGHTAGRPAARGR